MSDIKSSDVIGSEAPVFLLPNQITTHPRFNVRPFSSVATAKEDRLIEELALGIETVGQLDALIITPQHVLIAGHRRRKAVMVANERRTARGQSLLKLRCTIDHSGGDGRQKAIQSNLHRKDGSPMDLAYLIAQIRQENNWKGWAGTKKVADYLGVNEATVSQHERFLYAEKELQNSIHEGRISAQSGLDLLKGLKTPDERAAAVARAEDIQAEDRLEKTLENYKAGKKNIQETTAALSKPPTKRIEHPAIVKAIRERHTVATDPSKKLCLSRSELIHSLADLDADGYSESGRSFVRYLVNEFSQGRGTVEELRQKFAAIGPDLMDDRQRGGKEAIAS